MSDWTYGQIQTVENRFIDCAPGSLKFYSLTPRGSDIWDFGPLGSFNTDTVTMLFPNTGTFTVTLGAFSQVVTIVDKPKVMIDSLSIRQGCLPFTFSLRNATTLPAGINIVSREWFLFPEGSAFYTDTIAHTILNIEPTCNVQLKIFTNSASCNADSNFMEFLHMVDTPKLNVTVDPFWSCDDSSNFNFVNLSTVSAFDTPIYRWSWNLPSPTSFIGKNLGTKNYKYVNGIDTMTLRITTKYGCFRESKVPIEIDTTHFTFTFADTICAYSPAHEWRLKISGDTSLFGYLVPVNTSTFYASVTWNDTVYEMGVFDVPTGHYPMTISKYRLTKPSCVQEETQDVYVINDKPVVKVVADIRCNSYLTDTVFISGWTPNVKYASLEVRYVDQYNGIMKRKFFTVYATKPYVLDTFYYIKDVDSFFRNGGYAIVGSADFHFNGTYCTLGHTDAFSDTINFYTWITSNKTIACRKDSVMFKAFPNLGHEFDSVHWLFDDGSPMITSIPDSPWHKDTVYHQFSTAGKYKVRAIAFDKKGCMDTSQGLWVTIGDTIAPQLFVDKDSICYNEDLRISKIGPGQFENLFFVTDSFREMNCPQDTTVLWKGFNHPGMQKIYLYGTNNGCKVIGIDSVYVRGPKFLLDYALDCQYPDSVLFYIRDTFGIGTAKYNWYFGDTSAPFISDQDSFYHKFASGDFKIRVDATDALNPITCPFYDTVEIPIKKVKAFFDDTLFCKYNVARFDPLNSIDYGHQCKDLTFNWFMKWGSQVSTNFYTDTAFYVVLPADTTMVSLVARAVNGCEDTLTRQVISTAGKLQFALDKNFRIGQYYCRPMDTIKVKSSSSTPFELKYNTWSVFKHSNKMDSILTFVKLLPSKLDTFFVLDPIFHNADTFIIRHGIEDKANCNIGFINDTAIFYNDHAIFLCPDTVCENSDNQISLTTYDPVNIRYSWYKDYVLLPNDTTNVLTERLPLKGGVPTKYIFKIIRNNITSGCVDSFVDTTLVNYKPRLSFNNTFDNSILRCHPGASTQFSFFDAASTDLHYYWRINGVATGDRPNNPFNLSLNPGITVIEGNFTTTYGCKDTWVNRDTVINLKLTLTTNKPNICRGDTLVFRLSNMQDVDTLDLVLGDGKNYRTTSVSGKTKDSFKYYYKDNPLLKDTANIVYIAVTKDNICPRITGSFKIAVTDVHSSFDINSGDTMFCFNQVPIQNTSTLADSFVWDFGDGNRIIDNNGTLNSYNYTNPGTYRIYQLGYRLPSNCVDTSTKLVTLYPNPKLVANLIKDTVCLGESLEVNYTSTLPNSTQLISPDHYKKGPYTISPIKTMLEDNGIITLEAISENDCRDTVKLFASILQPKKVLPFDTTVSQGSRVKLPFSYDPTWKYTWTPPLLNPSCINCSNPEMQFIDTARYKLIYSNKLNCFLDSSIFNVRFYKEILVKLPEAFTPNGDGINDQLCARGFGMKSLRNFKVYNRLGQLIFVSEHADNCWDGTYKGVLQNQDVYFYTYEAESYIPGKIIKGEGNFMLLR